ncbi:MAG TPA: tRNA pseudouridine(38-40) synthase TruA [Chlamydiales bacterium]|nr:tRNA pseudouridine(38-40) synthase TruA [Chlamydiales bacterium]
MRYKLTIAYDGTAYSGWQAQPNAMTIQPLIQKALATLLRAPISLTGSGRTDAGVHARGQTAHFDTSQPIIPKRLKLSLNALLPLDIRILQVEPADPDFHARYSAKSKIYHYHLHLCPVMDPFKRHYATQVFGPCDLNRIANAIPYFLGTHDFLSFANESNQGSASRNSIRTLYSLTLTEQKGAEQKGAEQKGGALLAFEGNGFLYKMVRNIMGVLLDIGAGKIEPKDVRAIFSAKNRCQASAAAPPQGLILMKVNY